MPELSFIVPVYKAEAYLPHALDTLRAQTFADWEAILVDDGSPDGCAALCDAAARQDPRFRVIHQKNQGVSAARNAGLDAAQGTYIHFLDADDALEPNMAELLLFKAREADADLVLFGSIEDTYDAAGQPVRSTPIPPPVVGLYRDEPCKRLFPQIATLFFVTRQLFRRSLIEQGRCRFSPYKIGEDALFFVQFYRLSPACVLGVDAPLYHYSVRANSSASQSYHPERLVDNFYLSRAIEETVAHWGLAASAPHADTVRCCKILDLQFGIKNLCLSPLRFSQRAAWLRRALQEPGLRQAVRSQPLAVVGSRNDQIKLALLKLHWNAAVIALSSLNNRH